MPKITKPLTVLQIKQLPIGTHAVGGASGLYLRVSDTGARSWIYRAMIKGNRRDLGLGALSSVSVDEARKKAVQLKSEIKQGIDPAEIRKVQRRQIVLAREATERGIITFEICAEEYLPTRLSELSNKKHKQQWQNTLATYVYPSIGHLPVDAIDQNQIANLLKPAWHQKHETMSRVRQRIEAVFAYAIVRGYREKANPALWKQNLEYLLPNLGKKHRKTPHRSMPVDDIPGFIELLDSIGGYTALAIKFLIYTASRSGSIRTAEWSEIDRERKVWNVPADHMKEKEFHRVPLSTGAIETLKQIPQQAGTNLIFPNSKGTPLSDNTLSALMRRHEINSVPHGFRASFSTWCAMETDYQTELREAALAHRVQNMVIEAYQRSDLLEKRRSLMEDWSMRITP